MEKLLGGYATDTLTGEERRSLFAAALENQALFDALADEQALRDLLQDPASRAHLMAALGEQRMSLGARIAGWLRRPSVLALAGAVAAGIVLIAVVQPGKRALERTPAATVAVNQAPRQDAQAPAAPAREPQVVENKVQGAPAPTKAVKQAKREDAEPERQKLEPQNAPAPVAAPAAASSPPPPPPPPPAQPQAFEAAKPMLSLRDAGPAPAAAAAPPPVRAAESALRPAPAMRKEVAAAANARDLYYAGQPAGAGGSEDQKTAKKQKASGRAFSAGAVGALARTAAVPAAGSLPGIRYSIQRRGADGSYTEINPSAPAGIGDSIRLRLEANQEGTVAVARRGADGTWKSMGESHLRAGEPVYLPAGNPVAIAAAGELHFQVKFLPAGQTPAATDQLTEPTSLLRDQEGMSVYVVNPRRGTGAGIAFEILVRAQ
jgi:hypothetical protein